MEYKRRISREEAQRGYILITKNALKQFPTIGESFQLKFGDEKFPIEIKGVPCQCRGPDKPHEHYHLEVKGSIEMRMGNVVSIAKGSEDEYILKIK